MPPAYLPNGLAHAGLALLLEASDNASDARCDAWDFAVLIDWLKESGLSMPAIQWLIAKGYLEHRHEFTPPGEDERVFRPHGKWNFRSRSGFVLTAAGVEFARSALLSSSCRTEPRPSQIAAPPPPPEVPFWDGRRLTFRGETVLELSRPAPNERGVLQAFQKAGWVERVDDPLPAETVGRPKRRLHNTINALNRRQNPPGITFSGDGTGLGIRWRLRENP